jgi:hypothetical protein
MKSSGRREEKRRKLQAPSSKPQATSIKLKIQASSGKHQATSNKRQATSLMLQALEYLYLRKERSHQVSGMKKRAS